MGEMAEMYRHSLRDRWRGHRLALAAVVVLAVVLLAVASPVRALDCEGVDLGDGCLFTITGGDTPEPNDGFAVTNVDGVPMWDFVRGKDAQAIGYPISQRWFDGPFTMQAFQKVILQWDPSNRSMNYYNTLDALADRYPDVALPFVPTHQVLEADRGVDFATITRNHLALLDQNQAIKDRFLSEPDWLNLYGLPIRYEEREVNGESGAVQMLRAQRTVFVVWNVPAPGTTVGRVNLQNVPDKVKRLSNVIIPDAAEVPVTQDTVADLSPSVLPPPTPASTVSAAIDDLEWVQDGIAASEEAALQALRDASMESRPLFEAVMGKSWVQDGISADELSVINDLTFMASEYEPMALRILRMPFLETVEASDDVTVGWLEQFDNDRSISDYLNQVLSHPTLGGSIKDEHVHAVTALLPVAYQYGPGLRDSLLNTLLDPEAVITEERSITLPHTGQVLLAVVRPRTDPSSHMEVLERIVRRHERFMDTPLPTNYVSLLVADVGGPGNGGGGRMGLLHIDVSYQGSAWVIAHEAGHMYWGSPWRWMGEGGAELLRWIVLDKGEPPHNFRIGIDSCDSARSLLELEQRTPTVIDTRSTCHYSMGFGLFHNLYNSLGEAEFRRGFRELYVQEQRSSYSSEWGSYSSECIGVEVSRCFLRAGFVDGAADPEMAAIASGIIDRWYYGP